MYETLFVAPLPLAKEEFIMHGYNLVQSVRDENEEGVLFFVLYTNPLHKILRVFAVS